MQPDTTSLITQITQAEERDTTRRFQVLIRLLTEHLYDIQVFKIGNRSAYDVYVVGRTATGDFAGVATKVVET